MKFDAALPITGLKDVPAIAKAAEEIGFDALWTQETQHDPFLPCALIAEHTARLNFGTAVAVSFARSPANLAYTAWDLAAQSNGRFILGLGTQVKAHIERRFGQPWPESPVKKLREQIEVMRAFWDCWQNGTKLNFRGEYYKITLMSPFFQPPPLTSPPTPPTGRGESLIPIYIAGVNTGLAKLAGELCDGFLAHPFHSIRYMKEVMLPAIEDGAKKANRKREDVAVSITAFIATTSEEMNFARAQISFYASTPSYRPVMDLHGWAGVAEKLSAYAAKGEWAEMPMLITDEMLSEFCLVTEEDKLASELKKRYEGIADRLTLYTPFVPGERDEWWKMLANAFNNKLNNYKMNKKTKQVLEDLIGQAERLERHKFPEHIMKIGLGFRGSQQENSEWEIEFDIPDEGELDKTILVFRLFNQHSEKYSFHQLDKLTNDLGLSDDFKKNLLETRQKYFDYINGYPDAVEMNFFEEGIRPTRDSILKVVMNGSGLVHTNDTVKRETYKHWSRDGIRRNVLLQEFTKIVLVIWSLIQDLSKISKQELVSGRE